MTYDPEVLDEYDDSNMKDLTYNIILDPYGYMIGIELNEDPDQYLFLTGIDLGSSNLSKRNADANVIFMDGTMDTVTVDMRDSKYYNTTTDAYENLSGLTTDTTAPGGGPAETRAQLNSWFTYTVDSNGVYTWSRWLTKSWARPTKLRAAWIWTMKPAMRCPSTRRMWPWTARVL